MAIADAFATTKGTPDFDPWPLLDGLADKPVLIVRGETSDLFSVATAERMVEALPEGGTGHRPAHRPRPGLDEPEAVAGIDRLLARVLATEEASRSSAA